MPKIDPPKLDAAALRRLDSQLMEIQEILQKPDVVMAKRYVDYVIMDMRLDGIDASLLETLGLHESARVLAGLEAAFLARRDKYLPVTVDAIMRTVAAKITLNEQNEKYVSEYLTNFLRDNWKDLDQRCRQVIIWQLTKVIVENSAAYSFFSKNYQIVNRAMFEERSKERFKRNISICKGIPADVLPVYSKRAKYVSRPS